MINSEIQRTQSNLAVSRGEAEADILFINGNVVNVFTGKITRHPIAVIDGRIAGFETVPARQIVDLAGKYISPGFIESHIHIESSKLSPLFFSDIVQRHGTTTVIADPHEIANVKGIEGIKFMLAEARKAKIDIFFMVPSCVPATNMETSGAVLTANDIDALLDEEGIIGIAEMMNFPGTMFGAPDVLDKLSRRRAGQVIDGHAPGLRGNNLSAYIYAGPSTDHECTTLAEAEEKLAKGMNIFIREGSTAHNMDALLPLVNSTTERRFTFATDDRSADDLVSLGHLDHTLQMAVAKGLDPLTAIRMVTLNPAEIYGLKDRGSIKPGNMADLVILDDLNSFTVHSVWKDGEKLSEPEINPQLNRIDIAPLKTPEISVSALRIPDKGKQVRVIGVVPGQIVTENLTASLESANGELLPDPDIDILKIVVVERHSGEGGLFVGFVKGMGISGGAIASTVAHDSHNIIAIGDNDDSIVTAVNHLIKIGGGQVVVAGKSVTADLPLPIAGLMIDQTAEIEAGKETLLANAAFKLGIKLDSPFMALSFLALPVIPALKITDKGLVDVERFEIVSLHL